MKHKFTGRSVKLPWPENHFQDLWDRHLLDDPHLFSVALMRIRAKRWGVKPLGQVILSRMKHSIHLGNVDQQWI